MAKPLAINGGEPALPRDSILPSPPTTPLDEEMVLHSMRGGIHAWGEDCEALQREWAAWNGNRFCIALNSGTAALHMSLVAAGLSAGDEVLTPAYSWTSSATAILHHNGIPVFVDIDPTTCNIDPAKLEEAITSKTRAILAVHLHGIPVDMEPLLEVARRRGLDVVEDACQAHGALYKGQKVGTLASTAAFSLNQNKMLSAGEGGLFVTDDPDRLEKGRSIVLFGDFRDADDGTDRRPGLGWMYRCNELCAAYARAQLTRLDEGIRHARWLFDILCREMSGLPGLLLPTVPDYATENAYNFVCHVDPEAAGYAGPTDVFREAVVSALSAEGVPASVWQRRILPEMAAITQRNAYGNGSPWRESGSTVIYDPYRYPNALRHADSYFILGGLRLPNGEEIAHQIAGATRAVFERIGEIDIDRVARGADTGLYERGWKRHQLSKRR